MSHANNHQQPLPLLPYLCQASAILGLVLVGELLALVLVLAQTNTPLSWSTLGAVSMVTQWIMLSSALALCQLRGLLNRLNTITSGCLAYGICLLISAVVLWAAQLITFQPFDVSLWLKSFLIAAIFSGILLRYLYVQQQLSNQQQAELQSRLQSLQSRIRPHFLFNSMNTIASLISINPAAAEKAVENLSDLFRSNLQDADLVPLMDEITLCRRYIDIEQMRLAERLQMVWNIQEPITNIQVPSLFLQPLVENAIYHGIQRLTSGGAVVLTIAETNEQIHIRIENPIPVLSASETDRGHHIALANIEHRLQLHYKNKAQISTEKDESNKQFIVDIVLPISTDSTDHNNPIK
ncbi:MAG: sensor histidine kinase [Cellvibrionaceae bacterium]